MPLAPDSALDVSYQIDYISNQYGTMRAKYFVQGDSSYPEVFKNIRLSPDQFNDSDIHLAAEGKIPSAVYTWREFLGADSFDAASYYDSIHTSRYKVTVSDSAPNLTVRQALRLKLQETVTEDSNEIRTSFSIVALDSNEVQAARGAIRTSLWTAYRYLEDLGRLDSVRELYGLDSGTGTVDDRINFEYSNFLNVGDSASTKLGTFLGLNDSDLALWFVDANEAYVDPNAEEALARLGG